MADAIGNFASLQNDAPNVMINKIMYELAERHLATGQCAKDYTLENYMSKTLRIVRYSRFNLPTDPLVEGVPPDAVAPSFTYVDIPVEQWGIVSLLTDVAQLTITHPILQIAMERCALAIAELTERENVKALMAGTSVIYGNVAASNSRDDLVATGTPRTDRFTTSTIINATVRLRAQGAPPYEGDLYAAIIQPQQEGDLYASDTTFQNASNLARVRKLENAEIGVWMGCQFIRGNFLPIFVGVATPDGTAISATKALATVSDMGGALTTGNYLVAVVAREIASDYERKISQTSGALAVSSSVTTGSVTVQVPSSVNYVYDIYMTKVGATILYKVASRRPASSVTVITTQPAGTEDVAPVAPASGVEVFIAWVLGRDAFARVKLNGMSMQSYITPAGASWSNALAQGRKVGCKIMYKAAIQDNNFLVRLETVSAYPSYLPA